MRRIGRMGALGLALVLGASAAGAQTNLITGSGAWSTSDYDHCLNVVWGPGATGTPPSYGFTLSTSGLNCVYTFTQPLAFPSQATGVFSFDYSYIPPGAAFWGDTVPAPAFTLGWGSCATVVPVDTLLDFQSPVVHPTSVSCTSTTPISSLRFAVTLPHVSVLRVDGVSFAVATTVVPEPSSAALLATGLLPLVPLVRRRRG